jgi:glycosyltransferase involved in cell wall biosynthesis
LARRRNIRSSSSTRLCYLKRVRAAAIVPSYQVGPVIADVVTGLRERWPEPAGVIVIDDGSTDDTAEAAERAGADVIRHGVNLGKGVALRTGLEEARRRGFDVAVTVDGDGQHPPAEALRLHEACDDPSALVLGIRDLVAAGAPRPNQLSNRFSNVVLSAFIGRRLADTQCGLRRYPIADTLDLGGREDGYGFEAEVLIRGAAEGMRFVELPIQVIYPPEEERISHFDSVRDPTKIVLRVLGTVASTRTKQLRRFLGR